MQQLPAGFELVGDDADSFSYPPLSERKQYIADRARHYRLNPDETIRAMGFEGLQDGVWQSNVTSGSQNKVGGRESSYGDFQMYVGSGGRDVGLGNDFINDTGLDPSDQRNWKEMADYSLARIAKNNGSLRGWYGPTSRGIDRISFLDVDENTPRLGAVGGSAALPEGFELVEDDAPAAAPQQRPELSIEVEQPGAQDPSAELTGLGKAAIGGLQRGATYLAGLPGDAGSLMRNVAGIEGERFTGLTPTSQQIKGAAENVVGEFYEPQTNAERYVSTAGEMAVNAAFPGSKAMRVANVVAPAVLSEGARQLAEGTEYEAPAAVGGAIAGALLPSGVARAVTPFRATPARQQAVETLRREGVKPTAGDATGNKSLRYAENEIGGGATARIVEQQQDDFTRAALRRAGIDADRATPEVIDGAFKRIGGEFDRIAANNTVVGDAKLGKDLTDIVDEYKNLVGPGAQAPVVENTAIEIARKAIVSGEMNGKTYQSLASRIARQARKSRGDPEKQEALYALREALDDAFERTLQTTGNPADFTALKEARRQYRNMLVIEKTATGAGEGAAAGAISPAKLRQATVSQDRRGYARGKGDFAELARAGEAVMSPMPQSGTAPRAWARAAPSVVLGGVAGGAYGQDVQSTLLGAVLGPAVAGRVLMSRPVQGYLGNQLVKQRPGNALARTGVNALLASPFNP